MESPNLFVISLSAFIGVFILLASLALVMRILIRVFPEKVAKTDAAVIAAVSAAVAAVYPGARVTKVEEHT
jgi:hypothetical protein